MTARFIVRLLDAEDGLLAWAEVYATATPQNHAGSCPFWPTGPISFLIERDGIASKLSVQWADLDVARVAPMQEPCAVKTGEIRTPVMLEPIWLVPGMRDVPLPAVTVRHPVTIGVPVGGLGVKDSRL